MRRLTFRLFGGFEARRSAGPPVLPTNKARGLLAYLACTPGQPHARDQIAALLWGDKEEKQARHSLRQVISTIRKAFPDENPECLLLEADTIALEPSAVEVDVAAFEQFVRHGSPSSLEQAMALYRGDFLAGLDVKEQMFEEWLMTERERLRELALDASAKLLSHQLKNNLEEAAIQTGLRLLGLDPLHEAVHQILMRLYFKNGRRGAALMQYQRCVEVLQRELGVEPEPETKQLYQDILRRASATVPVEVPQIRRAGRRRRKFSRASLELHAPEIPLIGREPELARLGQAIREARKGQGQTIAILGEAGIGKSRLIQELCAEAIRGGGLALVGRSYEIEQVLPFGPWINALRGGKVTEDPDVVQSLSPVWRVELARLFPELGAPSLELSTDPQNAVRLFESVAHLLDRLVPRQPLLLVLEDLHWADEMSLRLFSFLSHRLQDRSVLLVGTAREEEVSETPLLSELFQELGRNPGAVSFTLAPLSQADTGTLVRQLAGARVEESLLARLEQGVWASSQGNPFIAVETLRALREGDSLEMPSGVPLPKQVRLVVAQRLERLSDRAKQLVAVAAVIGREFDYVLLERAAALGEREVAEGVEELVRRRVLHGVGERFDFTHDRIRDVAYDQILPPRRKLLHGLVAKAMEELYAARLEDWYDALAYHFLEGNDLQKAVQYSVRAGERASAIYTWGRANSHFQTAFELLEKLDAEPRQQAVVLEKLALAAMLSGRGKEALGHWEKALSTYETLGDATKAATIHLQLAQQYQPQAVGTRDPERGYTHARKAVTLLEPKGNSVELALAYTRVGFIAAHRNEPLSAGLTPLEKGLALAQRLGDTARIGEAAASLGHVLLYHAGAINRGLELTHEGYEAAKRSGDKVLLADAVLRVSESYLTLRDTDGALHWAEEAAKVCTQSGVLRSQIQSSLLLGWVSVLQGDTARAILGLETAQETAKKAGVELTQISRPNLFALAMVPFFLGDWEKTENGLLKCIESRALVFPIQTAWLSGWLCLERGDLVRAKEHVREAVTLCETRGEKTLEVTPLTLSAEIASKGGDLDEAAAHLSQARKIMSKPQEWRGLAAEVHLSDGILATCEKRWQEALDAFQRAVEVNRQYRLPYYEARSLFEWGQMLISRNSTGDRERGLQLLGESLDIFQRIQAKKMVEKVLARKQVLES